MAEFLSAAGVDVYQAADSHTTISVLIAVDQTELAVRVLHAGFQLGVRP
jgi:aspartokinase